MAGLYESWRPHQPEGEASGKRQAAAGAAVRGFSVVYKAVCKIKRVLSLSLMIEIRLAEHDLTLSNF